MKVSKVHEEEINELKLEIEQLKQQLDLLETKLKTVEKGCACYRNAQKANVYIGKTRNEK